MATKLSTSVLEPTPPVRINLEREDRASVLVVDGVLDSSTYRGLRDSVIKAALDELGAVIVDVNRLFVPSDSAWSVFTSARWHVSVWPDLPILLACELQRTRLAITSCGVARYVPVYPTRELALDAVEDRSWHGRRRARGQLPAGTVSVRLARTMISNWLTVWNQTELIPVAGTVATIFIENVLRHTESAPVLIVESYRDTVTVAVEDASQLPASRHEDADHGTRVLSGLSIVSALCRSWGSTPTSSGKTVWALVGLENQL
jgi:hypothetical protein